LADKWLNNASQVSRVGQQPLLQQHLLQPALHIACPGSHPTPCSSHLLLLLLCCAVLQVARDTFIVFFSEVFDAMFRLCADSETNVQNAVQFLDNLVKVRSVLARGAGSPGKESSTAEEARMTGCFCS
jgi:hypothetical protein